MANLFYKLLGMFSLTDDYDDDDEDLDDEDDFDDEEEETSRFQIKKKEKSKAYNESNDYHTEKAEKKSNVLPYNKKSAKSSMGVCVIKPTSFDDGREISDTLTNGKAVVLNLEDVDGDLAQRIIDFTCGACYSMGGNLQKVSTFIFIVTPSSVDISGDFQELLNSAAASSMSMPGGSQSMMQTQMQNRYRF
jgi:cell division inhibitor SepF